MFLNVLCPPIRATSQHQWGMYKQFCIPICTFSITFWTCINIRFDLEWNNWRLLQTLFHDDSNARLIIQKRLVNRRQAKKWNDYRRVLNRQCYQWICHPFVSIGFVFNNFLFCLFFLSFSPSLLSIRRECWFQLCWMGGTFAKTALMFFLRGQ